MPLSYAKALKESGYKGPVAGFKWAVGATFEESYAAAGWTDDGLICHSEEAIAFAGLVRRRLGPTADRIPTWLINRALQGLRKDRAQQRRGLRPGRPLDLFGRGESDPDPPGAAGLDEDRSAAG